MRVYHQEILKPIWGVGGQGTEEDSPAEVSKNKVVVGRGFAFLRGGGKGETHVKKLRR